VDKAIWTSNVSSDTRHAMQTHLHAGGAVWQMSLEIPKHYDEPKFPPLPLTVAIRMAPNWTGTNTIVKHPHSHSEQDLNPLSHFGTEQLCDRQTERLTQHAMETSATTTKSNKIPNHEHTHLPESFCLMRMSSFFLCLMFSWWNIKSYSLTETAAEWSKY